MKKVFLSAALVSAIIFFFACVKSAEPGYATCTGAKPADDSTALLNFAKNNGITPVADTTGLYYQIIDSGKGPAPVMSSKIYVSYVGTLMSGLVFDSTSNPAKTGFLLSDLIKGWQIGIPKIGKGGHIKLLVPSAYGYGCAGSSTGLIPRDAPIYFDVVLADFQ